MPWRDLPLPRENTRHVTVRGSGSMGHEITEIVEESHQNIEQSLETLVRE